MKNKTSLEWISELALRLATIAHDPDSWESHKAVETDTKSIVIDRTENNLSRYVRECEAHFSALYDAEARTVDQYELEKKGTAAELAKCREIKNTCKTELDAAAEVLQVFAQFANVASAVVRDADEYVTIRVPVHALRESRRLLGGSFRDYSNTEDIPT